MSCSWGGFQDCKKCGCNKSHYWGFREREYFGDGEECLDCGYSWWDTDKGQGSEQMTLEEVNDLRCENDLDEIETLTIREYTDVN